MAKTGSSVRYHFSAPESDTQIAEWVKLQHNFSTSMRILIKDYIAKYGMRDISCLPLAIDDAEARPTFVAQSADFVVDTTKKIVENDAVNDIAPIETNTASSEPDLDPMLASIMG